MTHTFTPVGFTLLAFGTPLATASGDRDSAKIYPTKKGALHAMKLVLRRHPKLKLKIAQLFIES
jgi:hypothetical protein